RARRGHRRIAQCRCSRGHGLRYAEHSDYPAMSIADTEVLARTRPTVVSEHELAAVQMDGLAVNEATRGAEIDARVGNIVDVADTADRDCVPCGLFMPSR